MSEEKDKAGIVDMRKKIVKELSEMFKDDEFGFDVFVSMKGEEALKQFVLFEGAPDQKNDPEKNFKRKIQNAIVNVIKEKFMVEEAQYDTVYNIADNQNKFYVIEQEEKYCPFGFVTLTNEEIDRLDNYSSKERENVKGFIFAFFRGGKIIWGYQHLYETAIPNRKGNSFPLFQQGDVFVEQVEPLLLIAKRVDVLLINNEIITDKIELLQKNFGFETFIQIKAQKTVVSIEELGLVSDMAKVSAYVERTKKTYARKMMRIKDSKVLQKPADELYKKVTTLPRWKDKFDIDEENKKIVVNTYAQVENLIDLLDERYTRSDVTDEEYDTGVKKWIAPASDSNS